MKLANYRAELEHLSALTPQPRQKDKWRYVIMCRLVQRASTESSCTQDLLWDLLSLSSSEKQDSEAHTRHVYGDFRLVLADLGRVVKGPA